MVKNNVRKLSEHASEKVNCQKQPDGGWGWVVVAAGVFGVSFNSASISCFSVFYLPLKNSFDSDYARVVWINGLYQAGYGLSSVCTHLFIRKFGFRRLCMVAGAICGISIFISNWSFQLWQLQILVGLIPGLCIGQTLTSTFAINARYFKKRLNITTQILCLGFTIGGLATCPIFQLLIENYGWRGALQVVGGFYLNLMVVGAVMRPPPSLKEDFVPSKSVLKFDGDEMGADNHELEIIKRQTSAQEMGTSQFTTEETFRKRWHAISEYLHLGIFLEPLFYAYTFGWVTFSMSYYASLQYLVPFGSESVGLTSMQSSSLVSALMVGELLSRIVAGLTFDRISIQAKILVTACRMFLLAVNLFVVSFLQSYISLLIGCVMLGVTGGGTEGIYCVFIADFFGANIYAAVYGYGNLIIYGLVVITTYGIGVCVDMTGRLGAAFYVGGSSALMSSLISVFMYRLYMNKINRKTTK